MPATPKDILIAFLMGIFWGYITANMAKKKGRDSRAWFFLGFLFNIFAFGILLFLPNQELLKAPSEVPAISANEPQQLLAAPVTQDPKLTTLSHRLWYYLDAEHNQVGPVDFTTLKELKKGGKISLSTFLWSEGMTDWKHLDDLSYLKTEIS